METPKIALSHSRLSDFNACPLKFKLKYLDKAKNFQMDQQDKSIHLVRGDNVHKALEAYLVKRKAGQTPETITTSLEEVRQTIPLIEKYIDMFGIENCHPEAQVSVDTEWKQVEWFSKQSYYRAILDLICKSSAVGIVADYKTGKFKDYAPDNGMGQLELSSAIALSIMPIEEVKTIYLYVDHKKTIQKSYSQKDKERLVNHFVAEHQKVNSEVNFDPTHNQYCGYCEAVKAQCKFSKKL